jgi:hypothetical protein
MAKKKKAPEHRPMAGDKHVTGYMKGQWLTDWHSKNLGWKLHREISSFRNTETDQEYEVVVLVKELKKMSPSGFFVQRYTAGVSMGEGMLFRGETCTEWTEEDAIDAAKSIGEYWMDIDQQDYEKDQEEQRREFEEEHSG